MILVDTSVVIDYIQGKDAKLMVLLPTLPVAICGIVRAELLHGARHPKHRADMLTLLSTFSQLTIAESIWDSVGDNLAALRASGLPAVTNQSEKGGAAVAAAALNALLYHEGAR